MSTETLSRPSPAEAALAGRYGTAAGLPDGLPSDLPWNDTLALLLSHRSVRGYRPDPLPAGTLEMLVAAAQSAATSSNMQSWSVVAVTDAGSRARMAAVANGQAHITQCPLLLVFVADQGRHARLAARLGTELAAQPLLETFLVAAIDCGIAAQNAVVAAESLGLSTVYIGALRNNPEAVARELALPPGSAAMFGLCVGYAAEGHEGTVRPRLPQSVVLHAGRYDTAPEEAGIAAYDEQILAFSARVDSRPYRWTERVVARLGRLSALHGREALRAILGRLGFPLN
ncbi:nitroreductase family protein [Roseomonas sp. GC11]|uniref:nitroreductase family protein n=1 Tax=Roseomonas sp. GC11 TaxID=2950546 RepID=UPI00210D79AE|nr:nitroreductase family protein [Roseomonas sp. GC11]MCQ4161616.1 nitroreductase family protein [Roseomonas sp. GC11]